MTNKDNLDTGMHPFLFGQSMQAEREHAARVAQEYNLVQSGSAGAALADAKTLLTGEQITLPQLASAARAMLERSQIWFAMLLGIDHHLALAHQDFLELWRKAR